MIEYQEALKTQKQHWQQQMKKADENHKSLLSSMMKHVTLARGGGWRDEMEKYNTWDAYNFQCHQGNWLSL